MRLSRAKSLIAITSCVLAVAACPSPGRACESWALAGDYALRQSNGIDVSLHFERTGDRLTGQARFYSTQFSQEIAGPLEGYIEGNQLHFRVSWYLLSNTCLKYYGLIPVWCWSDKYDENGIYEATISDRGEVRGSNYPFERPQARTDWFLKTDLACAPQGSASSSSAPVLIIMPPKPVDPVTITDGDMARDVVVGGAGLPVPVPQRQPTPIPPDPIKPVSPLPMIPVLASTASRCKEGFVWREASTDDQVCVTPESRERVRAENQSASARVDPNGAYGPNTCLAGFVWREALAGDLVCVTPEVRALVRQENAEAANRKL